LASALTAAGVTGAIGGDILTGYGAAKVFNGTTWIDLGADVGSIISQISDSTESSTANGITVDVTTSDGVVTAVGVSADDLVVDSISASTANFGDLTASTATFTATSVSANSLTINGSTVEQIADTRIASIPASTATSTATGITVSVTTQGGSVTAVSVDATSFGNVMHFKGVVTELPSESNVAGDIVVIGAAEQGETLPPGLVAGQEYIYTSTGWELIGDQNTYALNAYSSTASVYAGATSLSGALDAAGAAIDGLTASVSALKAKTDAYVGGTSTSADQGVEVSVAIDASTMAPSVTTTVTPATLFADLDASVTSNEQAGLTVGVTQVDGVVTGVTAELVWLDASGAAIA